jgi:hypothetical protein
LQNEEHFPIIERKRGSSTTLFLVEPETMRETAGMAVERTCAMREHVYSEIGVYIVCPMVLASGYHTLSLPVNAKSDDS